MNKLMEWLTQATMTQKRVLATLAGSSLGSLRLAAKGYRKSGELDVTAEFAARLEQASFNEAFTGLPALPRETLCKTCAQCPYQLKCNAKE